MNKKEKKKKLGKGVQALLDFAVNKWGRDSVRAAMRNLPKGFVLTLDKLQVDKLAHLVSMGFTFFVSETSGLYNFNSVVNELMATFAEAIEDAKKGTLYTESESAKETATGSKKADSKTRDAVLEKWNALFNSGKLNDDQLIEAYESFLSLFKDKTNDEKDQIYSILAELSVDSLFRFFKLNKNDKMDGNSFINLFFSEEKKESTTEKNEESKENKKSFWFFGEEKESKDEKPQKKPSPFKKVTMGILEIEKKKNIKNSLETIERIRKSHNISGSIFSNEEWDVMSRHL